MPADAPLRPVPDDELAAVLAHALHCQGCRRVHRADEMMVRITAERLARLLAAEGFVVMKGPDARPTQAPAPYRPDRSSR